MMRIILLAFCCIGVSYSKYIGKNDANSYVENEGKHWALIVAGSSGYYNYRHQADACHAYHIMLKHGIPEENIVLMMYDDIAYNEENPTPGIIINHPKGKDVYKGVKIDYRREDVTPKNFLAIMRGDKEAMEEIGTGRVIESGPNDHIFVNFVDHGAPGILGFPSEMLHVKPFISTIKDMANEDKFKQMVFYIEACESGSMFYNVLPDNINVFATTAANRKESSYACYYDKIRKTYLGDVYSVKWMEDSDVEDLSTETLQKQFKIVKKETNTSHVMEYGDMGISKESVSNFQGGKDYVAPEPSPVPEVPLEAVASEDVPLAILSRRFADASSVEEAAEIEKAMIDLHRLHENITYTFDRIVKFATAGEDTRMFLLASSLRRTLSNYDCYQQTVDEFSDKCFDLSKYDYAMRGLYQLVNLCEENIPAEKILNAINQAC